MKTIQEYRKWIEGEKGSLALLNKQETELEEVLNKLKRDEINIDKAREVLQVVAQATQKELEYHIAELVSLAMSSIFPDPYVFHLDFVLRRGKSEADLSFSQSDDSDERMHPLASAGGGAIDVAAFALRVALWNLQSPKIRNCIILDEPFRFLSKNLQRKASSMLVDLSEKLSIQFIINTHERSLIEKADKIFVVSQLDGVSEVKEEIE